MLSPNLQVHGTKNDVMLASSLDDWLLLDVLPCACALVPCTIHAVPVRTAGVPKLGTHCVSLQFSCYYLSVREKDWRGKLGL